MEENEKDKKARTSITIDKDVLEQAKETCIDRDTSFSAFVESAVRKALLALKDPTDD